MNNYFICIKHGETELRIENIIEERVEENMDVLDHVYSHLDDGSEDDIGQNVVGHNGEGFDVEELMAMLRLVCCYEEELWVSIILRCLIKHWETLFYKECKGCDTEHTVLWIALELLKLKARNRWSDTSFSTLLELLTNVLPKSKGLPSSAYQAKIICLLTLYIEKAMLAWTIAAYIEKNINSKINVQHPMLVGTNGMIIVWMLRMIPTKGAIKCKDDRGRMMLPIRTLKGPKREKFPPL
jgi:hypothetical protein